MKKLGLVLCLVSLLAAATLNAATHNISDGFAFGGPAVNPNNGWTFADGTNAPLTSYVPDWNAPDFGAGQPGWAGLAGGAHAGWAEITPANAVASGKDVVGGEVATHGSTIVSYTPGVAQGDPLSGSVSLSGSLHHLRAAGRVGPWTLLRNNTDILAAGFTTDATLSINNGPLDIAQDGTFYNTNQVTVSGNQLTGISYNPGDFFNLRLGVQDFAAVDLTIDTLAAAGNGFAPRSTPTQVAYYRFEEASGVDIIDSVSGLKHGEFLGIAAGSERTTDVAAPVVPQTGAANTRAADLRQGGSAMLTGSAFIFNGPNAGGPNGDATLEWFMKVPNDASPDIAGPNGHTSMFWTNPSGGNAAQRFNIFWDASFTGAPNSDRFVSGDFVSTGGPTSMAAGSHNNGSPLSEDAWQHVAIVRTDATPGDPNDSSFAWDWYINGALSATHHADTTAAMPTEDVFGWSISGRPQSPLFYALIDEVRMTAGALTPAQFLNAVVIPEPSSIGLLIVAMAGLAVGRRKMAA